MRLWTVGFVVALIMGAVPRPLPADDLALDFSTYLGGSGSDILLGVDLDSAGNIYVVGTTMSSDFPTRDPYQPSYAGGSGDVIVTKFSSPGTALLFSTYLGGSESDMGIAIAVDAEESAWVTGDTLSGNFPTASPYQGTINGLADAFVTSLSSSGSALEYSTYLGGDDNDGGEGIAVDGSGDIYVTGYTYSGDFPTQSSYQPSLGGSQDCFVTQFHHSGSALYYSTYLGGSIEDSPDAVVVDDSYCAYVTGTTVSADFPTRDPYQAGIRQAGWEDGFVSKLSASGSALVYSTYLGGSLRDYPASIGLDIGKNAYVCGATEANNFPLVNPFQSSHAGGQYDAFASCLQSSGSALIYSTYLGGDQDDGANGIAVEPDYGDAYIAGYTSSGDFPTLHAYQTSRAGAGTDAFLLDLAGSGDQLHSSTYLGGEDLDRATAVVRDPQDRACLAGYTASENFPLCNPYQSSKGGGTYSGFAARMRYGSPPPVRNQYHTDFDGDGTSDIALFRPVAGLWAIRGLTRVYFGLADDDPQPHDFNGDATTEIAVFKSGSGLWAVRNLSRIYFGSTWDAPAAGDYDGDGCCDPAVFRSLTGLWAVRNVTRAYFGAAGDRPVPGYYDADDLADIAVFRGSSGMWSARSVTRFYFGGSADDPVPGDYDGDGKWDGGIFRPSSSLWSVRGVTRFYLGAFPDSPVPADFNGNHTDDAGIFRDSAGLWSVRNLTRIYFGATGDIPVTR